MDCLVSPHEFALGFDKACSQHLFSDSQLPAFS